MDWFNYYGLIIMAIIMLPNIIYAVKHKDDASANYNNKAVIIAEQIGRYGCFAFMIFNIPYTYFNFWFNNALIVYLSVNGALCLAYLVFWVICWNSCGKLKALSLSIIPSCIFLFSGIVLTNIPLIVFAVIFTVNHIIVSYKNAVETTHRKKTKRKVNYKDIILLLFVIFLFVLAVVGVIFGADIGNGAFPLD